MADDVEMLVRQSLNAVDRSRRSAGIATGIVFVLLVLMLGFLFAHARLGADAGASKVPWVASVAHMTFVGLCTTVLAAHVTRMTKAVVRAIELSTKKE